MSVSAAELRAAGVAFVEATVVRCKHPSSARPGDRAIVLGDGTIDGFVGGACADATVRLQALRALETGEPVLLRILPGAEDGPSDEEGAVVVANPCLSGGALELFLEPCLPPPRIAVSGDSPVARAVVELGPAVGFAPRLDSVAQAGDFALVVASLGHADEDAVRRGLEAGCEYVGLVASRRRGTAVLEALRADGVADEALARVRTPAGLDIGAHTHAEIALAILAELVAVRRAPAVPSAGGVLPVLVRSPAAVPREGGVAVAPVPSLGAVPRERGVAVAPVPSPAAVPREGGVAGAPVPSPAAAPREGGVAGASVPSPAAGGRIAAPVEAIDPVCGMYVALGAATPMADGHAFCCEGCREAWLARAR